MHESGASVDGSLRGAGTQVSPVKPARPVSADLRPPSQGPPKRRREEPNAPRASVTSWEGAVRPAYGWISRTLIHLKSTSDALSQRNTAMGPPQVKGMPVVPPHFFVSPPQVPSSTMS